MLNVIRRNELEMNWPDKQFVSCVKRFKQKLCKQHKENCYTLNAWTYSKVSRLGLGVGRRFTLFYIHQMNQGPNFPKILWRTYEKLMKNSDLRKT